MATAQQNQSKTAASLVFGVLLLIVMIIVILIQLTIITTYFMTSHRGRCVYKDENGSCICQWTNKKSCDSVHGMYNTNLTCNDGFDALCGAIPSPSPSSKK
jgi:hypothetical protein